MATSIIELSEVSKMTLHPSKQMAPNALSYSTKHWIRCCNSLLLLLVALLCGLVLYEIHTLDLRLISVIDSSRVAIDLMSVDLIEMQPQPYWQDVQDGLAIYSAFHKPDTPGDKFVLVIGSSLHSDLLLEDTRCLVKYEDSEISLVNLDVQNFNNCSTVFLHCSVQRDFLPSKIALVSVGNTIPKQWVNVEIIPKVTSPKVEFSDVACVKPLKENVTLLEIENFITFSEENGVSQFFFYNYNASEKIMHYLSQLMSRGHLVHVLPFGRRLDYFIDCSDNLSEFIQDCIYRSQRKYRQNIYVADLPNTLKKTI